MSDDQRGPYTPPRDESLAFDPRGVRDARPMPMTLIASGVVLVALIGGVIIAYAGGFHHKDEAPKVVGEPVATMKTAPPPGQAGPSDPASRLAVFSNTTTASAPPTFAAAPEQPAERPKPQLQVQPSHLPPVRIATSDEPAPVKPAAAPKAVSPPPATTAAPPTQPTKPIRLASAAPSAPAPAKAATSAASTPAASGGVGAQIGAFSSKELADKGFADVAKLASTEGHGKRVEAVDHGGATLYRTTVTGFADRAAAKSFCDALTAKGHACIVKG